MAKTWVSVDVTPLVTGNGTYSFALTTSDTTFLEVATKENGASTAPQLVLSPAVAPANSVAPSISGTPQDGQQLTAAPGSWTGTQPITYTYQWQRCDQTGNSCTNITGATNTTYTATTPDVGNTITVNVTATNTAGNTTQTAAPTTTIQAAAPANTTPPLISGTPQSGKTLTAAPGTWTGTQPITYTYQWQRCNQSGGGCSNLAGATGATYTAVTADVGNTITVNVTATNTAGNTTQTAAPTTTIQPVPTLPANSVAPSISGTPQDGQLLTADSGSWTGTQPITYTYQWQRCNQSGGGCSNLAGATGATYTAVTADVGNTITVNVTATNTAGNTTQTAAPTTIIQAAAPVNTVIPKITGSPGLGSTLTADSGKWTGSQPIAYAYQWQRCDQAGNACANVAGASSTSYAPSMADLGLTLRFSVTATNGTGSASATSAATAPVGVPPTSTAPPQISGTAQVGATALTADPGTWAGSQPIALAYQWQRCDAEHECNDVAGATGPTLDLTGDMAGATIVVEVTATNAGGSATAYSAATAPVEPATPVAPVSVAIPTVSGNALENGVVSVDPGTWSGTTPLSFAYQWNRCNPQGGSCTPIQSATAPTYTVTAEDVAFTLEVAVTASNVAGSATAQSAATSLIAQAAYPQVIAKDGPRGFWRLDETNGRSPPTRPVTGTLDRTR